MKRLFILCAVLVMGLVAMASDIVRYPTAEFQFRTNGSTDTSKELESPTGWTKNVNGADVASIECTYSARMWGQEQFDVTGIDFSKVTSVTVSFTMAGSANYRLGAWIYPNADWTEASEQAWTEGKCPIVENFKQIFGQYPGYVGTSNNYVVRYEGTASPAVQDLVFTGAALDAIKNGIVEKNGKKYINLIITFSEPKASYSTGRNPKYYSIKDPTKQPKMTITKTDPFCSYDEWDMTNFISSRSGGTATFNENILNVKSGTDNAKRGDIKNTTDNYAIGDNKVIFYEIECTSQGISLNNNDKKLGFTTVAENFNNKAVVSEQVMRNGTLTLPNGHQVIYFDIANTNANVAYFSGDVNNKFTTEDKGLFRQALAQQKDVSVTGINFTLIGTDDTDFKIYKMGSTKDVNILKHAYGLMDSYDITISDARAATLILPFVAIIPSGVKAYTLSYNGEGDYTTTSKIENIIPANTPVYLTGNTGTYTFTKNGSDPITTDVTISHTKGALTGVYTTTDVPENSYILWNRSGTVGFYKSNNSTVAPFRCYLTAEEDAPANLRIIFGEATGISEVQSSTAKVRGTECFNLNGQRVNNSAKGIVIINGKKFINK